MVYRYISYKEPSCENGAGRLCKMQGSAPKMSRKIVRFMYEPCDTCNKEILIISDNQGVVYTLDAKPDRLYTLADGKIYGQTEGYRIHRCKYETY